MVVYTLEQRLPQIDLQKMPILAIDLGGYVNVKLSFGAHKTRTHTLKSRRTENESLFDADFGPEA